MNKFELFTLALARASKGNLIVSTITVMLFFVMFTLFEAGVETLIWGDRFHHWLDPVFQMAFIGYAAYSVWMCAALNQAEG